MKTSNHIVALVITSSIALGLLLFALYIFLNPASGVDTPDSIGATTEPTSGLVCGSSISYGEDYTLDEEDLATFLQNPACHHWTVFIAAANSLYLTEKDTEQAVFYSYVGALRGRVGAEVETDLVETVPKYSAAYAELIENISTYQNVAYYIVSQFNALAESNIELFREQRKASIDWDLQNPYTPEQHKLVAQVSPQVWNTTYEEIRKINNDFYQEYLAKFATRDFDYAKQIAGYAITEIEVSYGPGDSYADACQMSMVAYHLQNYKAQTQGDVDCYGDANGYSLSLQYDQGKYFCFDYNGHYGESNAPLSATGLCSN